MFTKQDWDEAAKRLLDKVESNVPDADAPVYEVPVSYYLDEDRWRREVDILFKKKPLILALSCELAEPNSFKAINPVGVPILLTRGDDDKVRGFINKCRHRGVPMTGDMEACGVAKRFACPYHAWTYNNKGMLIGLPGQSHFGTIPEEYRNLIEINVEERAGMIWGILTPDIRLDLEQHLGDMLPMLDKIELGKWHLAATKVINAPNWKFVQDGFIEHYHFNILHKDSVGTMLLSDATVYDEYGPHVRYLVPGKDIGKLRDIPESEWQAMNSVMYSFFIFPNTALGFSPSEKPEDQVFVVAAVWPGPSIGTSVIYQWFAMPRPIVSDQDREAITQFVEWQADFIEREDFWAIQGQQNGLASMADQKFLYGGLERIAQHFERNVNALIDASYEQEAIAAQ